MKNRVKEDIVELEPEKKPVKKDSAFKAKMIKPLVDILSGNFLEQEQVVKHLPYMLFMVFLALVYIANGYMAEGSVRSINKSKAQLKELRSEYITTKSDLMYTTKQSELAGIIEERELGLKESIVPPKKIVVTNNQLEAYSEK